MAATPTNAFERTLGKLTPEQLTDALPLLESVLTDMMIEQGIDTKLPAEEKAAGARVLAGAIKAVREKVMQVMQPRPAEKAQVRYEIPPPPQTKRPHA